MTTNDYLDSWVDEHPQERAKWRAADLISKGMKEQDAIIQAIAEEQDINLADIRRD